MSKFNKPIFETVQEIPDLLAPELLLPADRPRIWAPEHAYAEDGVTGVEMAYLYLSKNCTSPGSADYLRMALRVWPEEVHEQIASKRMSHTTRAVARVLLHPVRDQAFDMVAVYDSELVGNARYNRHNELPFFQNFINNYSVLERGEDAA